MGIYSSKTFQKQIRADIDRLKKTAHEWYRTKPDLWGLPTGLPALDKLTGGMPRDELVVLAGGPASGKTALAMQVVVNSAEWLKTNDQPFINLLISAEMSRAAVYRRTACSIAGITTQDLMRGNVTEEELTRHDEALEYLYSLPLLTLDAPGMTSEDVKNICNALIEEGLTIGTLAVDYIQQLYDDGANETLRVNQIVRNLVYCKTTTGCNLLALSQYSRAKLKEGRPPQPEDLLGSGNIERSADQIWAMHEPLVAPHEVTPGIVHKELYVLKNRNGPKGKVALDFIEAHTRFTDPTAAPDDEFEADFGTVPSLRVVAAG